MSSFANTYDRQAAPESWITVSYAVRRLGCAAWAAGLKSLQEARQECEIANRTCTSGHAVYAEQEYVGELPSLRGAKRAVER